MVDKSRCSVFRLAIWRSLVFGLGLLLILNSRTFAQQAPLTDCDTYAASDLDPQHTVAGVPLDKLNPALAIPACDAAVRQYPNNSKLTYPFSAPGLM